MGKGANKTTKSIKIPQLKNNNQDKTLVITVKIAKYFRKYLKNKRHEDWLSKKIRKHKTD